MTTPPNDDNPQWVRPDAQPGTPGPAEHPSSAAEPAGGSKFGTTSYSRDQAYDAPAEEPRKYALLKRMTLVSFGLFLIFALLSFIPLASGQAEEVARAELEGMDLAGSSVEDAVALGIMFAWTVLIVPVVISVTFYLVVYGGLKRVKAWGRITGIVMAFIGPIYMTIFGVLSNLGMTDATVVTTLVISLAWAAVTIWWLVLAFSAPVRGYIAQFRH